MDVKVLYTNIPNNEGIAVVKQKHDNWAKEIVTTKVLETFLALILTRKNFSFNLKFFLQIKGSGMGTYAPLHRETYSCLSSERDTSIISLKTNPTTICALLTNIPYSQALRIKPVCSTFDRYKKRSNDLVKWFVEKGYKENII